MTGADLAREVSTGQAYVVSPPAGTPVRYRVAAVDLGIKAATPAVHGPAWAARSRCCPRPAPPAQILAVRPGRGVLLQRAR